MLEYSNIGTRIRKLREARGFSRFYVASHIYISEKYLYEIETKEKCFSIQILIDLSNFFNVSSDYILFGVIQN